MCHCFSFPDYERQFNCQKTKHKLKKLNTQKCCWAINCWLG
jgi:hypothetical protein